jgi:hypothetical protein
MEKTKKKGDSAITPLSQPYDEKIYTNEWQYKAMSFDAGRVKAAPEVTGVIDNLFPRIIEKLEQLGKLSKAQINKKKSRIKFTCKVILFNLYLGWLQNIPVKYSRNSNDYIKNTRYRKLHFTYSQIIPSIDAFIALRLIYNRQGEYFPERKNGRLQSRMWATEKLSNLMFDAISNLAYQVEAEEKREIIILRDSEKNIIDYKDTIRTRKYRNNLRCYNEFISKQVVKVHAGGAQKVSLGSLKEKLLPNFLQANATLTKFQSDIPNSHRKSNSNKGKISKGIVPYVTVPEREYQERTSIVKYYTSITNRFPQLSPYFNGFGKKPTCHSLSRDLKRTTPLYKLLEDNVIKLSHFRTVVLNKMLAHRGDDDFIYEKRSLKEFGISQLDFVIDKKKLYRVFNKKRFNLGGRFYGALHTNLPKELRANIFINEEPTVELDYSAHHVRIPYHLAKIEYQEDPYRNVCKDRSDDKEREMMKHIFLMVENTRSRVGAIFAIKENAKPWYKHYIGSLDYANISAVLGRIEEEHSSISNCFYKEMGRKYQFIDSEIAEAILLRMTKSGIPCLPVHDSFIVPEKYQEQLYQAMTEEYRRVLGFTPVIK